MHEQRAHTIIKDKVEDPAREERNNPKAVTRLQWTRRRVLGLAGALTIGGLATYGTIVEPNEISLEQLTIRINSLPPEFDGFRIALISDLHFAPFTGKTEIAAAVTEINKLKADLVAVVGDFVTEAPFRGLRASASYAEPCAAVLSNLSSQFGTTAVLGNHDHVTNAKMVGGALRAQNIRVLQNENFPIERAGHRLWIAGIDDALEGAADIARSLNGIPSGELTIVLVHEPDVADTVSGHQVALQLSGHSHGGQVRMPGIGPLYLPPLGRKYPAGLYRVGTTHLYTNRGIGVIGVPVRFDCPPEVTLIELKVAAA